MTMLVEIPRMRKPFEGAYFHPGVVVEGARLHPGVVAEGAYFHDVVVLDSLRL